MMAKWPYKAFNAWGSWLKLLLLVLKMFVMLLVMLLTVWVAEMLQALPLELEVLGLILSGH